MLVTTIGQAKDSMSELGWHLFCEDCEKGIYGDKWDPTIAELHEEVAFERMQILRYELDTSKNEGLGNNDVCHGPTVKMVRQILMNELGLTRESIREVVRDVVKVEAVKVFKRMTNEEELIKIATDAVERELVDGSGYGSRTKMLRAVQDASMKKAEEIFDKAYPT